MSKKIKKFNTLELQFIEALREKQGWTSHRLVKEIQTAVEADRKMKSTDAEVSPDYISRILRGKRPANHNWRLLIAKVFGLTLAGFSKEFESFSKPEAQKSNPPSKQVALPIDYWPHMVWRSTATVDRKIAVKLYGLSKSGLKAVFKQILGEWRVPEGFSGYQALRQAAWEQFIVNFQRMKKEPPNPEPLWHVDRLHLTDASTIALDLQLTDYQDVLVTSSIRGLNKSIQVSDGRTMTIQEWLAEHWLPGDVEQPIIPCARQLVINLLVLTRDNEVVNGLQGLDNPDSSNSWATGVSRLVYPKNDSDSYGIPDLKKAATSACLRELGIQIDGDQVQWVVLAAGLKLGSFTFFGVVRTNYDQQQIRKMFEENRKAYVKHNLGHEVIDIEFVKINVNAVSERLKNTNYRPYMELGLALLLWLQDEAVITIEEKLL